MTSFVKFLMGILLLGTLISAAAPVVTVRSVTAMGNNIDINFNVTGNFDAYKCIPFINMTMPNGGGGQAFNCGNFCPAGAPPNFNIQNASNAFTFHLNAPMGMWKVNVKCIPKQVFTVLRHSPNDNAPFDPFFINSTGTFNATGVRMSWNNFSMGDVINLSNGNNTQLNISISDQFSCSQQIQLNLTIAANHSTEIDTTPDMQAMQPRPKGMGAYFSDHSGNDCTNPTFTRMAVGDAFSDPLAAAGSWANSGTGDGNFTVTVSEGYRPPIEGDNFFGNFSAGTMSSDFLNPCNCNYTYHTQCNTAGGCGLNVSAPIGPGIGVSSMPCIPKLDTAAPDTGVAGNLQNPGVYPRPQFCTQGMQFNSSNNAFFLQQPNFVFQGTEMYNISKDWSQETQSPVLLAARIEPFSDRVMIGLITDKPTNATLYFYARDSYCGTPNMILEDKGMLDPANTGQYFDYSKYKPFHPFVLPGLFLNTTYYYKYAICDPKGNCAAPATCKSFQTTDTNFTSLPVNLTFTPPQGFQGQFQFFDPTVGLRNMTNVNFTSTNAMMIMGNQTLGWGFNFSGIQVTGNVTLNLSDALLVNFTNASFPRIGFNTSYWQNFTQIFKPNSTANMTLQIPFDASLGQAPNQLYKCDDDGVSNCVNASSLGAFMGNSSNFSFWALPYAAGFSTYYTQYIAPAAVSTPVTPSGCGQNCATPTPTAAPTPAPTTQQTNTLLPKPQPTTGTPQIIEQVIDKSSTATASFTESQTTITVAYTAPASGFSGIITYRLPLNYADYKAGKISISPEPTSVREGSIIATWDVVLDPKDTFKAEIVVDKKLDKTVLSNIKVQTAKSTPSNPTTGNPQTAPISKPTEPAVKAASIAQTASLTSGLMTILAVIGAIIVLAGGYYLITKPYRKK